MKKITIILVCCLLYPLITSNAQNVKMKTTKKEGDEIILTIVATTNPVRIDWGNGLIKDYTVATKWADRKQMKVALPVDDAEITITNDNLQYLLVNNCNLTSFEMVGPMERLSRLDIQDNQLTQLKGLSYTSYRTGVINAWNNLIELVSI